MELVGHVRRDEVVAGGTGPAPRAWDICHDLVLHRQNSAFRRAYPARFEPRARERERVLPRRSI